MKFKLATAAAAVLMSATASQAADLAKKAPVAVDYVKVCDAYGAGFFYIPGTDTCLKIGGYVRTQVWGGDADNASGLAFRGRDSDNNFNTLGRLQINVDARSQTEYGVLRAFGAVNFDAQSNRQSSTGADVVSTGNYYDVPGFRNLVDKAYIQFAGFTAGYATSMWDFFTGYTMQLEYGSAEHDDSRNLLAYTFGFGNGLAATISVEDPTYYSRTGGTIYGGVKAPDVIANINLSQAWGSAQIMAAAHHMYGAGVTNAGVATGYDADDWGYAVGAGIKLNVPMFGAGDQIALQVVYADGASTYTGSGAADFDDLEDTNTSWSIEGGFKHVFSPAWTMNFDAAYVAVDYANDVAGSSLDNRWDAAINLAWTPVTNLTVTGAVEYRSVEYVDGSDADGFVFGLRAQRNF